VGIAFFDCFSGASGDMLLGSLLDAGLPLQDLEADLARLGVGGYRLTAPRVTRRGLTGTHLRVLAETDDRPARNMPAIEQIVSGSDLPERVKGQSLTVFRRLAHAEATIHGTSVDRVHFHEIGAVDSLVDIVGFVCALERLEIATVYSSPLPLGSGSIQTEHGRLPAPAPATLALLAQARAPTVPGPVEAELVTPTGAALLTEFATFVRPPMTIQAVGYGFGTREFDWPNALRVWLGQTPSPSTKLEGDQVVQLASNLDDTTGEALGYVMERLLEAGALDVWFTPIQMKKNRPATQLSVLARLEDADALASLLLSETPTLGVRRQVFSRDKARREFEEVDTPWGPVRVKIKTLRGKVVAVSPEYDDCARLAVDAGIPLTEIIEVARHQAKQLSFES
jgi:uncharacterized protein (TIGR00299 family) protein